MRIIDPYREENRRAVKWLRGLSHKQFIAFLKDAGILDKHGHLAAKYRTPKAPKSAKPRTTKAVSRKRAAS